MTSRFVICALVTGTVWAQLIPTGTAVPQKSKPPVVFLNGYQQGCTGDSSFASTFGTADQVLQANGEVSLFFDNCSVKGSPGIEDLGVAFGKFLAQLKFENGQAVTSVDVVAHSLGGLILRSYLSGKQPGSATYLPPANPGIRKVVFLATPHFGTEIASLFGGDAQTRELSSGSTFLFDLNTWNQGTDDLRGVDAIAVIGNGGTGRSPVFPSSPGFDDGVVPLSSGSLAFVLPGRTRVVPFCHISGGGIVTLAGLCDSSAPGIANIKSANDAPARIAVSFLNGTSDWQSIGTAAESDPFLSKNGGLDLQTRTSADATLLMDSATATPAAGTARNLAMSTKEVAFIDLLPAGQLSLKTVSGTIETAGSYTLPAGVYKALVLKPGPIVGRVTAPGVPFPLSVAPGEFVEIKGDALAGSTTTATSSNYPTQLADVQVFVNGAAAQLYYVSPTQINAIIPDNASGLVKLTVQNTAGSHSVNVLLEPSVPAVFTLNQAGSGPVAAENASNNYTIVTDSNRLRAGDIVALFLTGLGTTTSRSGLDYANQQPTVTIGGRPCALLYAGRAPGFKGLDQINCQVPSGLSNDAAAQVIVFSGQRGSNVGTIAIQ